MSNSNNLSNSNFGIKEKLRPVFEGLFEQSGPRSGININVKKIQNSTDTYGNKSSVLTSYDSLRNQFKQDRLNHKWLGSAICYFFDRYTRESKNGFNSKDQIFKSIVLMFDCIEYLPNASSGNDNEHREVIADIILNKNQQYFSQKKIGRKRGYSTEYVFLQQFLKLDFDWRIIATDEAKSIRQNYPNIPAKKNLTVEADYIELESSGNDPIGVKTIGQYQKQFRSIDDCYNTIEEYQEYIGRTKAKKALKNFLNSSSSESFKLIHGLGGMGKTSLVYNVLLEFPSFNLVYENCPYDPEGSNPYTLKNLCSKLGIEISNSCPLSIEFEIINQRIDEIDGVFIWDNIQYISDPKSREFIKYLSKAKIGKSILISREFPEELVSFKAKEIVPIRVDFLKLKPFKKYIKKRISELDHKVKLSADDVTRIYEAVGGYPMIINLILIALIRSKKIIHILNDLSKVELEIEGSEEHFCNTLLNHIFNSKETALELHVLQLVSIIPQPLSHDTITELIKTNIDGVLKKLEKHKTLLDLKNGLYYIPDIIRSYIYNSISNIQDAHLHVANYYEMKMFRSGQFDVTLHEKIQYHHSLCKDQGYLLRTYVQRCATILKKDLVRYYKHHKGIIKKLAVVAKKTPFDVRMIIEVAHLCASHNLHKQSFRLVNWSKKQFVKAKIQVPFSYIVWNYYYALYFKRNYKLAKKYMNQIDLICKNDEVVLVTTNQVIPIENISRRALSIDVGFYVHTARHSPILFKGISKAMLYGFLGDENSRVQILMRLRSILLYSDYCYDELIAISIKTKSHDRFHTLISEILEKGLRNKAILTNVSIYLFSQNEYKKGISLLHHVIQDYPHYTPAYLSLARAYYSNNCFRQAINVSKIYHQTYWEHPSIDLLYIELDSMDRIGNYNEYNKRYYEIRNDSLLNAFQKAKIKKRPMHPLVTEVQGMCQCYVEFTMYRNEFLELQRKGYQFPDFLGPIHKKNGLKIYVSVCEKSVINSKGWRAVESFFERGVLKSQWNYTLKQSLISALRISKKMGQ